MTDWNDKTWYYSTDGSQQGPVDANELRALVERAQIPAETPVWRSGMADWLPATEIAELEIADVAPSVGGGGLKLGAGRKFDKINLKDEDPDGNVDVQSMLAEQRATSGKRGTGSRLLDRPKPGFFESFGLTSFESAFFAVMLVITGIASLVKMEFWHGMVIAAGFFTVIAAQFAWMVRAFIKHWGWGLAVLVIPMAAWVYLFFDFKNASKSLALLLVGVAAIITPISLPSFQQSPLYEYFEELKGTIDAEIERQQQEIENRSEERLGPLE